MWSFSCKTKQTILTFSPWLWVRAAQLLVTVCGVTKEMMEELAVMWSVKGMTTRSDLLMEVNACLDKLGLKWDKLAGVTADGCPNLKGI